MKTLLGLFVVFILVFLLFSSVAQATDFTSDNYKNKDPVISSGGGYGTSTNYRIWHSFSGPAIGSSTSTDDTIKQLKAGFLYFPEPSSPPPPPPPPPPSPLPPGGFGGPPTKLKPPPLIPPFIPPIIPPFLRFITGELIPIPGCGRADLNCDGSVDLVDLSILFTKPKVVTGRILSLLFSDWTRKLPIPIISPSKTTEIAQKLMPPRRFNFAELSNLLRGRATTSEKKTGIVSVFTVIFSFLKKIVDFFIGIINFILGIFGF